MKLSAKLFIRKIMAVLPDPLYIKLMFKHHVGYSPNLKNPVTFSEKIQWLKLNDFTEEKVDLVDKIKVKDIVAEKIGSEHIIPTLAVWDSAKKIDLSSLPEKFVLKCNHDGHSVVICKDKNSFDLETAKKSLAAHLKSNAFLYGREKPYKYVKPFILAEKFIGPDEGDIADYKFFCFDGKPVYCQVITDRTSNECIDFFDMDWNHQEFTGLATKVARFENSDKPVKKPETFDKMKKFAAVLSKDYKFSRIDFYETEGQLYFGEITFYPAAGFGRFEPQEWNKKLGDLIEL